MNDKVGQAFSRGRQRGQAARRRPAAHHREGRRARRRGRLRRHLRGLSRGEDRRPGRAPRSSASRPRSATPRSTRPSTSCASSAAPSRSARPAKPRGRRRPRDDRLRRQDRRRAVRGRQGRGLPVHHRRRPDARGVRQGRARHEDRRVARPSRCSSRPTTTARTWPARKPTSWSRVKKIEAPHLPEVDEALRQVARHRRRHGRGAARRHHARTSSAR